MSGGVDSSVSALLLKRQGYNVIGIFMKNWDESDSNGNCTATQDYEDALAVSAHLGIPCYAVNFSAKYWDNVFENFLDELKAGRTPNPDILCNREIKFKALLEKAQEMGADYLATGHYCRTGLVNGEPALLKGLDPLKDQSYFLYTVTSDILKNVLFPIGDLPKSEVRRIAVEEGLINAKKKDSTGICFIGKRDFKSFVSQYIAYHPGDVLTVDGKVIAKHDGSAYYTIGQRHGLGIGGPGDPWFVVDKDVTTNTIVVAQGSEHPALFSRHLNAIQTTWVSRNGINTPLSCTAKVRYRQADQACTVNEDAGTLTVTFQEPQRAVTPGQSIVFYQNEVCLGGGIISNKYS